MTLESAGSGMTPSESSAGGRLVPFEEDCNSASPDFISLFQARSRWAGNTPFKHRERLEGNSSEKKGSKTRTYRAPGLVIPEATHLRQKRSSYHQRSDRRSTVAGSRVKAPSYGKTRRSKGHRARRDMDTDSRSARPLAVEPHSPSHPARAWHYLDPRWYRSHHCRHHCACIALLRQPRPLRCGDRQCRFRRRNWRGVAEESRCHADRKRGRQRQPTRCSCLVLGLARFFVRRISKVPPSAGRP